MGYSGLRLKARGRKNRVTQDKSSSSSVEVILQKSAKKQQSILDVLEKSSVAMVEAVLED